jgi:hypothetical protein
MEPAPEAAPTAEALRVGLWVDSFLLPRWQRRLIEEIQTSSWAHVVLVLPGAAPPRRRGARHLLHDLYARFDERVFREEPDAFERVDVRDLVADAAVLETVDAPSPDDLARVRRHELDVAVRLGTFVPEGELLTIARHGIWSLQDPASGFWEVMEARPTTDAGIEIRTHDRAVRVVSRSFAPTDHISIRRTRSRNAWKSASFVARTLRDLACDGPSALEGEEALPPARPRPGNLAMIGLLARLYLRYARKKLRDLLTLEQWYPAYRFEEKPQAVATTFRDLVPLIPPRDRYWADPFPFRREGRTYLFVEELLHRLPKGHIAVMEIDPRRGAGECVKVLERDYHLSYPFVFEWDGEIYMLPESSEARKVQLFRCVSFPDRWEEDRVLLDDVHAVDATLAEVDGRWWMFVGIGRPGASWMEQDELHLFHAETPLGPWTPHRRNPVKSDCRSARPAGRPFHWQGRLYRPGQNCAGEYGRAIALNRVLRLTPDEYREEQVIDLVPDWAQRAHTLNRGPGLHVVDVLQRRRRFP